MKRVYFYLLSTLFILLSTNSFAAGKMIQTKAQLKTVTVYLNAAELTHQVRLDIPEGVSTLVIENLSPQAQEETLQFAFEKEGITILSSQFMLENIPFDALSDLAPLAKETLTEYNKLIAQRDLLSAEKSATEGFIAGLNVQTNKSAEVLQGSTQKLNDLMQYIFEKRKTLDIQVNKLTKELNDLDLQLQRLRERLKDQGIAAGKTYKRGRAVLQIRSVGNLNSEIFVRYLANAARWNHSYEIRGEMSQKPLKLVSRASVAQNTGLFWEGVKLRLVYGYAQLYQQLPTLDPWTLHNYQQSKLRSAKRAPLLGASNAYMRTMDAAVPVAEEAEMSFDDGYDSSLAANDVEVSSNMLNVSYEIKMPYDVLPNGREHQIEIQTIDIPAQYSYSAVPKLNTEAFLIATIKDYNQYGLFNSQAYIVFEKMRAGSTQLTPTNETNELPITLGVEPRIAIERKAISDKTSDVFLSSNRERTFTYDLLVRNNKKEAIELTLKDQYPLSAEENIKVELLETSGAEVNSPKGELTWKLQLAAGEAKTIRLSYKVRYPKTVNLNF